eukprot:gene23884-biopygen13405
MLCTSCALPTQPKSANRITTTGSNGCGRVPGDVSVDPTRSGIPKRCTNGTDGTYAAEIYNLHAAAGWLLEVYMRYIHGRQQGYANKFRCEHRLASTQGHPSPVPKCKCRKESTPVQPALCNNRFF